MADSRLIVDDEFVTQFATLCKQRGEALERIVDKYLSILDIACGCGVQKGEAARALKSFTDCARRLDGQLTQILKDVESACQEYVSHIDEADSYLF